MSIMWVIIDSLTLLLQVLSVTD